MNGWVLKGKGGDGKEGNNRGWKISLGKENTLGRVRDRSACFERGVMLQLQVRSHHLALQGWPTALGRWQNYMSALDEIVVPGWTQTRGESL